MNKEVIEALKRAQTAVENAAAEVHAAVEAYERVSTPDMIAPREQTAPPPSNVVPMGPPTSTTPSSAPPSPGPASPPASQPDDLQLQKLLAEAAAKLSPVTFFNMVKDYTPSGKIADMDDAGKAALAERVRKAVGG